MDLHTRASVLLDDVVALRMGGCLRLQATRNFYGKA